MRIVIASTFGARLKGLLGTRRERWQDRVLLMTPCSSVHTVGMRYALDIAFIRADGEVLAAYRDVAPGRRLSCHRSTAVLERASAGGGSWVEKGQTILLEPAHLGIYSFDHSYEQEKEVNHGQHWSKTQDDSGVA